MGKTISKTLMTHTLVRLAIDTIRLYVEKGQTLAPPEALDEEMKGKAGVFVSLKKGGGLRGCIGTFSPTQPNIAQEIIQNAISAATRDPRFAPVSEEELDELSYSVDVLSAPAEADINELDPTRYGVIVESGWKKGLLLPDLEGVDTAEEQVSIAREKAGIGAGETIKLYRFEVRRYK